MKCSDLIRMMKMLGIMINTKNIPFNLKFYGSNRLGEFKSVLKSFSRNLGPPVVPPSLPISGMPIIHRGVPMENRLFSPENKWRAKLV